MKYIKSGDKGQYAIELPHLYIEEILKRYKSEDLYFQKNAELKFIKTHRIDSIIKESEYKRIYHVTCFKDCVFNQYTQTFETQ